MATQNRATRAAVKASELQGILVWEPYRCNFFQAVRLLERFSPDCASVGSYGRPKDEVARFHAHASLEFPASEIQSLTESPEGQPQVTVNFMGLFGPLGVMPLAYTELVIDRLSQKQPDRSPADFLDIFNHRIISLFYLAWEKHRAAVAYERGKLDRFSHRLLDLVGLGGKDLQKKQDVADDSFMYYSGLLGMAPRSAAAMEQILSDYFDVPITVEQFAGAWHPIDSYDECRVGEDRPYSGQLGLGAVVGDEVWDQQSRIRLRLGPLTIKQYRDFLPSLEGQDTPDSEMATGGAWQELRALAMFFTRREFEIEVQFVLRSEDVPEIELSDETMSVPRLGWSTWLKSRPLDRNPDETVLILE